VATILESTPFLILAAEQSMVNQLERARLEGPSRLWKGLGRNKAAAARELRKSVRVRTGDSGERLSILFRSEYEDAVRTLAESVPELLSRSGRVCLQGQARAWSAEFRGMLKELEIREQDLTQLVWALRGGVNAFGTRRESPEKSRAALAEIRKKILPGETFSAAPPPHSEEGVKGPEALEDQDEGLMSLLHPILALSAFQAIEKEGTALSQELRELERQEEEAEAALNTSEWDDQAIHSFQDMVREIDSRLRDFRAVRETLRTKFEDRDLGIEKEIAVWEILAEVDRQDLEPTLLSPMKDYHLFKKWGWVGLAVSLLVTALAYPRRGRRN
jgi:hypothetical protein